MKALPDLSGVPHPPTRPLALFRPFGRFVVRRRVEVALHGADRFPADGPVILAANHIAVADGPVLGLFSPRPVHALTKVEMFHGPVGAFLALGGQIPLDRFHTDPAAVKTCLRVLADGLVVGIFPEGRRGAGDLARFHRGAAYLALASGARVVPVTILGTRAPGAGTNALPPRGGRIDLVYGAPYDVPLTPWPRTRRQVENTSLDLRAHLLDALDEALALTGRQLPGPLPAGQAERDPATSVTPGGTP